MATEYKSEDRDLESWIDDGVSFLQAEVTIFRDPAMFAKYGPLMQRIDILEKELKPKKDKKERSLGEESVGGDSQAIVDESLADTFSSEISAELDGLYVEAEKLYAEYSKNTEVWTLRRLNEDEIEEKRDILGNMPDEPVRPSSTKMSKAQRDTAVRNMVAWSEKVQEYSDELHTLCLAESVVSVLVKGKQVPKPTLDGIRRLRKRAGGDAHFKELRDAMNALAIEGVSIMAPHRDGAGA